MRFTPSALRRWAMTITAAAGLAAAALLGPSAAQAAAPGNGLSPDAAANLADRLGSRAAGSYLDATMGRTVVAVTDAAAAQQVRAAGGVARLVARNGAQLNQITAALDGSARITGTAWALDPASNQVVVSIDTTVTGKRLAAVTAVTARFGAAVRVEKLAGTLSMMISGGEAVYGGGWRCSQGFNVRNSSGASFFLTAGHCTNNASRWYTDPAATVYIGPQVGTSFPGNDYGIVRYDGSVSPQGSVYLYNGSWQDITHAGRAFVGQTVTRSGSTTGVRTGRVTATNATVTFPEGTVRQLIRTNVCAEPGDSGGPLFAGSIALGLTSGGTGNCSAGGTMFFQPVTEPLGVYRVNVF